MRRRVSVEEKVAKEDAVNVIRECRQSSMRERRALEQSLARCRESKLDRP
jgi:hypothetical protein